MYLQSTMRNSELLSAGWIVRGSFTAPVVTTEVLVIWMVAGGRLQVGAKTPPLAGTKALPLTATLPTGFITWSPPQPLSRTSEALRIVALPTRANAFA